MQKMVSIKYNGRRLVSFHIDLFPGVFPPSVPSTNSVRLCESQDIVH